MFSSPKTNAILLVAGLVALLSGAYWVLLFVALIWIFGWLFGI